MPSYQYHFVVLAKEPSRYSFIKTLDSVHVPFDGESDDDDTEDSIMYSVVQLAAAPIGRAPRQPAHMDQSPTCCGTKSIRAIRSRPSKKRALVDWIHWGGQLIISGPDSLDLLKGSFLEPYLPATSGGQRKIAADDPAIAELNQTLDDLDTENAGRAAEAERGLVGSQAQAGRRRRSFCRTPASCSSSARSAAAASSFPPCNCPNAT